MWRRQSGRAMVMGSCQKSWICSKKRDSFLLLQIDGVSEIKMLTNVNFLAAFCPLMPLRLEIEHEIFLLTKCENAARVPFPWNLSISISSLVGSAWKTEKKNSSLIFFKCCKP